VLEFPHDVPLLIRRRRALIRDLADADRVFTPIKLAILGGSTTQEIGAWIELFLLERGIKATIYHSQYNKYFEDTVVDPSELVAFRPDIVYLHLSTANLQLSRALIATESGFEAAIREQLDHLRAVWNGVWTALACPVVQNTFESPALRPLGHLDASLFGGRAHFVNRLNCELAREARANPRLVLHDTASLASTSRVTSWFAHDRWSLYKIPTSAEADIALGYSLGSLIGAAFGRSRKCLVLDLDNTCWGGVIGDDGPDRIVIGRETARGEAFTAFQEYCKALKERGILLAVCSKNEDAMARRGFGHRDSVLKLDDFAAFRANWEPKSENIKSISAELNIGLDSFVFVDDNPAERAQVVAELPMVAVPNVGSDVSRFAEIVDAGRYFEAVTISKEDLERTRLYAENAARDSMVRKFADYGAYLESLQMVADISAFSEQYLDRITQLTNKTNQFNLTTRRYTRAEMQAVADDDRYVTLYGRLADRFGDNGLVSVIIARRDGSSLHVDLWLMSCRVLKRGMEDAMLDALVARAQELGVDSIYGTYLPTDRNAMVAMHYANMGFERTTPDNDSRSEWRLDISSGYIPRNHHINGFVGERHS
jgi:FkbH-like protein